MKICIIGTRGFPKIQGGVEKHCEALYVNIAKLYNAIDIFVFRRKPYIVSTPDYNKLHFIDLPSTQIKGVETVIHSFFSTWVSIIKRADIIHYHNIGPALFSPLAKLFGIKVVLTYHSANYEHKKWGRFARLVLKLSEKIAFIFSDKIIFVNKFQMEKSSPKFKNKYVYIPNGIPKIKLSEKIDFIQKLGLQKKKYILAVGRITPEKGFDILIKAFSHLNTDYKLVIAGGVETERSYYKELQNMGPSERVVFTGYTFGDDLCQLYSNAALFVLSSRNEGFPIVLLEAMAYKLDVLVSDIPATHLVDLDRNDYFELDKEGSLEKKILDKLQNIKSRNYNLVDFDWSKIANQVYDIYHALIK